MSLERLVLQLQRHGVSLRKADGQLRIIGPVGALPPDLIEEVRTHKVALLELVPAVGLKTASALPPSLESDVARDDAPRFASRAQQRLWFLHQLNGGNAYNLACVIRLDGVIDPHILQNAFRILLDRHETLRTVFENVDGSCSPRLLTADTFVLNVVSAVAADSAPSIRSIADAPFDLTRDLPIRATLFTHTPERSTLTIGFHHIAIDGWSLAIFLEELGAVLAKERLPTLAMDYPSWVRAERAALASDAQQEWLAWWKGYLNGAPSIGLPHRSDREEPCAVAAAAHISAAMPLPLVRQAADAAASLQTTLFAAFAATFVALLAAHGSQPDVAIAIPVANRARPGSERLVGLLSNTIGLRCHVTDDLTYAALVRRIASDLFTALAREDVPFDAVVASLDRRSNGAAHAPFEAMLVIQPELWFRAGTHLCQVELCQPASVKCDLTLTVQPSTGVVNLEYRRSRFDDAFTNDFVTHLLALLEQATSNVHALLTTLPILHHIRAARTVSSDRTRGSVDTSTPPAASIVRTIGGTLDEPLSDVEAVVATIWRDLLGVERVSREDDFFALGGHSLLAMRLASRISRRLHLECTVSDIFEVSRFGDLVAALGRRASAGAQVAYDHTPRPSHASRDDCPASFAQERLWVLEHVKHPGAAYNLSAAMTVSGPLNASALSAAVDDVVRRHDVLSVRLSMTPDGLRQVVRRERRPGLEIANARTDGVARHLEDVMWKPFDLDGDEPLARFRLVVKGPDDHVMAVALHHSVADGWSMAILKRELAEAYAARRSGSAPPWLDLPTQYGDFAVAQRQTANSESWARDLAYWQQQLTRLPDVCTLPLDFKRPEQGSSEATRIVFQLPSPVVDATRQLAAGSGASIYMVLFGAFAAVASRLRGDPDLVVGTPFAGRLQPELEPLIGCFVNTMVLRVRVETDHSFRDLLSTVKAAVLACHAHQAVSFDAIVQALQPARTAATQPLFQMLFSMDVREEHPFALADVEVAPLSSDRWARKYDINLHFAEGDDGISGYLEFASDLFERRTAERLIDSIAHVLTQAAACPTTPLSNVSCLSAGQERELAEVVRPRRGTDLPCEALVHQQFAEQAARTPQAVALELGSASVSYAQLAHHSNQLAHHLLGLGVATEQPIAVLMRRSTERAAVLLGILAAGGCYLPLDCDWPPDRQRLAVDQAGAKILVADALDQRSALGQSLHVIDGRAIWHEISHLPSDPPTSTVAPDNLAYILFTSGTTGRPKGVMVKHRGVAHDLRFLARLHGLTVGHRVLQITEYTFDPSVRDLFAPLISGATAVLLSAQEATDPAVVLHRISAADVTHVLSMTPTMLRAGGTPTVEAPHSPEAIMLNGEPLAPSDIQIARARFGRRMRIFNQYGPTETTMTSCIHEVTPDDETRPRIPVGPPNPNTRIVILDESGSRVPIGTFGEVFIGGIGVARGYLGEADLSSRLFVRLAGDPDDVLWYRTNDVGRWLSNGELDLSGRRDTQLKVRGNRLESLEVESRLLEHPAIGQAAVSIHRDHNAQEHLAAYVVFTGTERPTVEALRTHLARYLPPFMVPSLYAAVAALPLTDNGKINRRRLPALSEELLLRDSSSIAEPLSKSERTVAALWRKVLPYPALVDRQINFFDAGGTSLLIVQLHRLINDTFQRNDSVVELFRYPTVAGYAAFLDGSTLAALPLQPRDVERIAQRKRQRRGLRC